ncbi:uncharacterized protein LOC130726869 isoform X2 [Lotus japonicus]|nr:uncharacterized protein LOC130726869 isoform X2 [Lotus japonicus]
MEEEMLALEHNATWDLVPLPAGKQAVGCKWVYTTKVNPDGSLARLKARLVAKGYAQTYGVDYTDTFSPVAKLSSVRILISLAATNHWPLFQLDVKNSFLHGDLQDEVYMEQPPGFVAQGECGKVCRLKKSLYGLKQSPRSWFGRFSDVVMEFGLRRSESDHTVFFKQTNKGCILLVVYVDDIVITGSDSEGIGNLKTFLQTKFQTKDLGILKYFLGIEVMYSKNGIMISQRKYVLDLLAETGLMGSKPCETPMEPGMKLTAEGVPFSDPQRYRRLVGKLNYLTVTRPDIAFPVSVVSQFMSSPTDAHWEALIRIVKYLKKAPGRGIVYRDHGHMRVEAFSDADWAGSPMDRKSTTGYCVFLGGNLISWKSKKQNVVARSSAEAEYCAMAQTTCELMWVGQILSEMGIERISPMKLWCDNQAALHISSNPVFHERTKHIEVDCHFIREKLQQNLISTSYVRTGDQLADVFTKALNGVNASDDRSTSAIEAKIRDVVEMNSVLSHSRPKCLVVDEIDGALGDGRGAVEVLLKLVSAERKQNGGNKSLGERQLDGKSSKKRQKTASLSRPVICICNDLYAPALRPLRQVAKVHIFVQPTVSRVVSRLKYICYKEGMKATAIALTALAEYTECDIRSCLNTLQFVSKKKETLNAIDIGSQVVGQKDMSKNVLDIWKQFFQRKRTKKMERESRRSKSFEFDYLYSLISNRGDSDLFLDGIHENILQLNYHDPVMQKTVKCFNSLGVYDLMHQYIMCTQQMRIHVYLPAIAVNIHHIVAQVQKPNIEWPKSYQRCRAMMMERMDILKTWHYQISPSIARNLSASSFVEDLISPLLHILSPPTIRPVALQLLSDKEKNDLAELVSTMVSYAVTYKTMKPDILLHTVKYEGADDLGLSLVPPISNFINFKDYTSNHYVLSLAMKKVLVHEVEKHKILHVNNDKTVASVNGGHEIIDAGTNKVPLANTNRATAVDLKTNENQANVFARQLNPNPITVSQNSNPNGSANATDKAKLLKMGKLKKPSSSSSFFDRFKKLNVKGLQNDRSQQKEATLEKHRCPLLFKFNEGFTNAVKRPVRMREFLS